VSAIALDHHVCRYHIGYHGNLHPYIPWSSAIPHLAYLARRCGFGLVLGDAVCIRFVRGSGAAMHAVAVTGIGVRS
jgi:hypothetical protein